MAQTTTFATRRFLSTTMILWAIFAIVFSTCFLQETGYAQERFRYPEQKFGPAELKYVDGVPILEVAGSAQEIGAQIGELGAKPGLRAIAYPKDFLRQVQMEFTWPILVQLAKPLLANFPEDHLAELEGIAATVRQGRDELIAANTMFDLLRGLGCSTFAVEASRSSTGKPMFGRNLDFPTLGYLQEFSLVTVYHPVGKRSFASVGFPGCVGVLSGMNDAGLTIAVLEVYESKDSSPKFDHRGTPYALCFRRLLEECATIEEAEKLLRTMARTTWVNLAVCDTTKAAVFEITPQSVEVRGAIQGTCASTNHFRTGALAKNTDCWRYPLLESLQNATERPISLEQLKKALHRVNQDDLTLQTMIFEPVDLRLHLAFGSTPSSALPMQTVELAGLLKRKD